MPWGSGVAPRPLEPIGRGGRAIRTLDDALLALSFLTIVPVRTRSGGAAHVRRSTLRFPVVGALVGVVTAAVLVGARELVGATPASVLALIATVALTGALHVDGLADTADGLGVRGDRERRLAVMRDPTVGAFGVVAIVAWALLFVSTTSALPSAEAVGALVAGAAAGRCGALLHAAALPPARPDGLGATFSTGGAPLAIATLLAACVAFVVLDPLAAGIAVGAGLLAVVLASGIARVAIGGRTGDTLGATIVVVEVAIYIAVLADGRRVDGSGTPAVTEAAELAVSLPETPPGGGTGRPRGPSRPLAEPVAYVC